MSSSTGGSNQGPNLPPVGMSPDELALYNYGAGTAAALYQKISPDLFGIINEEQKVQAEEIEQSLKSAIGAGMNAMISEEAMAGTQLADGLTSGASAGSGIETTSKLQTRSDAHQAELAGLEE